MKWFDRDGIEPMRGTRVICYCPDWNDSEYQVAIFNGNEFYYDEQPNEMFDEHVQKWALLMEAD